MSARHRQAKRLLGYRMHLANCAATTLAQNIAVAGALCTAFDDGETKGYDDAAEDEGYQRVRPLWIPGCGREVPR